MQLKTRKEGMDGLSLLLIMTVVVVVLNIILTNAGLSPFQYL